MATSENQGQTWDAAPVAPKRPSASVMVPAPSPQVVAYLKRAYQAEVSGYGLKGGGRDFDHEHAQEQAWLWLENAEARYGR